MAEFLKRAVAVPRRLRARTCAKPFRRCSCDIETRGEAAVRDWSLRLDGWAPDSFLVSEAEVGRGERVAP